MCCVWSELLVYGLIIILSVYQRIEWNEMRCVFHIIKVSVEMLLEILIILWEFQLKKSRRSIIFKLNISYKTQNVSRFSEQRMFIIYIQVLLPDITRTNSISVYTIYTILVWKRAWIEYIQTNSRPYTQCENANSKYRYTALIINQIPVYAVCDKRGNTTKLANIARTCDVADTCLA